MYLFTYCATSYKSTRPFFNIQRRFLPFRKWMIIGEVALTSLEKLILIALVADMQENMKYDLKRKFRISFKGCSALIN